MIREHDLQHYLKRHKGDATWQRERIARLTGA